MSGRTPECGISDARRQVIERANGGIRLSLTRTPSLHPFGLSATIFSPFWPQMPNSTSNDSEEKMNLVEFIRSMDQMKLEADRRAIEETDESTTTANRIGLRFLSRSRGRDSPKSSAGNSPPVERKFSGEQWKPTIRMKAFKNNRQDTFHSLAMCSEPTEGTVRAASSSAVSLDEDLMRMPFIEGVSSQNKTLKQKTYTTAHSEPLNPNGSKREEPKKRRILHTITQPDGSVVGFCTEESDNPTANEAPKEKPS